MSSHLEAAGISRFAMGEESAEDLAHTAVCAACRKDVEEFRQTLRAFRGTVREWSSEELALSSRSVARVPATPRLRAIYGMALILMLSVMGLRLSLQTPAPRNPPPAADADAELLMQVRVAVSRPVPRDLEPLFMQP